MTRIRPAAVIVLAAGEGTRMRSALPKVMHPIGGRSLLGHVLATARDLAPDRIAVVVRHDRDRVAAHAQELDPAVLIADQDEIKGTGRAAWNALQALDAEEPVVGTVLVLAGDVPLLDSGTLGELLQAHEEGGNAVTILTTRVADPTGYGRIVRDPATGQVARIVEQRDASESERAIEEINSSVYAFDAAVLREDLIALQDPAAGATANAQGEVYLTDVVALARDAGPVHAIATDDPMLVEGVNDRVQLAALGAELNRRIVVEAMLSGVSVVDPANTWIDVTVELEQDVTLLPGVHLSGSTSIGAGAVIGPDTTLVDTVVGPGAQVTRSHATKATVDAEAKVGPFTHLREGSHVGRRASIGAYSEMKNATLGNGSKLPHLSYLGDATVGENANVGAGVITANYDGVAKHHTTIGNAAFVGSDVTLVAPVTVEDGAFVAAGSTITRDVLAGDLAVERAPQKSVAGWVLRRLPDSRWARAARAALGQDSEREES